MVQFHSGPPPITLRLLVREFQLKTPLAAVDAWQAYGKRPHAFGAERRDPSIPFPIPSFGVWLKLNRIFSAPLLLIEELGDPHFGNVLVWLNSLVFTCLHGG